MTVKSFFKSNAFKCIITLLCVLLVSGIFLTIANGFLEVTDAEREAIAIKKIYGDNASITQTLTVSDHNNDATIEKGYLMDDGNYLVKSTGKGGYQKGTVTCWVVVKTSGKTITGVGKVVIDSQKSQTLMNQYTNDSVLAVFGNTNYTGAPFESEIITGATAKQTNTAITNSVNGAIDFVKASLGIVDADPWEGFEYKSMINTSHADTNYEIDGDGNVVFSIRTKGYENASFFKVTITVNKDDGTIMNYVINNYGSEDGYKTAEEYNDIVDQAIPEYTGKDITYFKGVLGDSMEYPGDGSGKFVSTGASNSNYLCFYAGAFATANYQTAINKSAESEGENA